MTDEIEIPLNEAKPGDMVLLGPFPVQRLHRGAIECMAVDIGEQRVWLRSDQIHRITRPISTEDALRAEVEQLKAQLEALKQSYDVVRAQAVAPPPSEQDQ